MIAHQGNWKDVAKYFLDTYIVVPEVCPDSVMKLLDAKPAGLVCRDSRTGEKGFISFDGDFEYEIKPPLATRKAWFMYESSAYLITRIPARMWRKGICSENTEIWRLAADGQIVKSSVNEKLINAYLQFKPSENDFAGINGSFALNNQWAFCNKTRMFFLWDFPVAKWAKRTNELFVPKEYAQLSVPKVNDKTKVNYV